MTCHDFFVQVSPIEIENFKLKNKKEMEESNLKLVLDSLKDHNLFFIVEENLVEDFESYGLLTVSYSPNSEITIVNEKSIDNLKNKKMKNALLFVEKEENLFSSFEAICENVEKTIELKIAPNCNLKILDEQLEKISNLFLKMIKSGSNLIVKNLNGWLIKEKFSSFGETAFFVDPDLKIYFHPNFYYDDKQHVDLVENFHKNKKGLRFSRSCLMCMNCETFFCDRNVYHNKIATSEYKVPSSISCAITTIITKHSKNIFNSFLELKIDQRLKISDLDRVEDFDSKKDFDFFKEEKCITNKIKGINFKERLL